MSKPKFKLIYQFELPQTKEVEETTEELDSQGIAIKVTRKTKKVVPAEFGIRRPNRSLYDEAEFYYNEMVGKGMSRGLLSSALLAKRLNNDGGVLTDKDNQERKRLFEELPAKEAELETLLASPENEERINTLKKELAEIRRSLQLFEMQEHSLFGVTAEALARTKLINWWTLFLLYKKDGTEWVPFFAGEKYDDKQSVFDSYDEDDHPEDDILLFTRAVARAQQIVAVWHYRGTNNQESIDEVLKTLEKDDEPASAT